MRRFIAIIFFLITVSLPVGYLLLSNTSQSNTDTSAQKLSYAPSAVTLTKAVQVTPKQTSAYVSKPASSTKTRTS